MYWLLSTDHITHYRYLVLVTGRVLTTNCYKGIHMITLRYIDNTDNCAEKTISFSTNRGLNVSSRDLHRVSFENMTIHDSDFSHCGLRNANFTGATFINCDFTGAGLINIHSEQVTFKNCIFDNAKFYSITLINSSMIGCRFLESEMHRFDMVSNNV